MIIDYEYYTNVYFGDRIEDGNKFKRFVGKAERLVKSYIGYETDNLDVDIEDMVKITICELVDLFDSVEEEENIKQERVGDLSVTYFGRDANDKARQIIYNNLSDTGLIVEQETARYRPIGRL